MTPTPFRPLRWCAPLAIALSLSAVVSGCADRGGADSTLPSQGATAIGIPGGEALAPPSQRLRGMWRHKSEVGGYRVDLAFAWDGQSLHRWTLDVRTAPVPCTARDVGPVRVELLCRAVDGTRSAHLLDLRTDDELVHAATPRILYRREPMPAELAPVRPELVEEEVIGGSGDGSGTYGDVPSGEIPPGGATLDE